MNDHRPESSTAEALRRSAVARYLQLASLFRRRIESGEWAVGAQIPTVDTLAKQCGVANMTVRQALDILEQDGLIERFRAKGTFVRAQPSRDLWCEVQTDWNGLLLARQGAKIEILSDERNVTLPSFQGLIGTPAPAYRHLHRRHSREGVSFLLADIYVDERLCPDIPESAYTSVTAMRLVADVPHQKIVDARQEMTIGTADLETANKLKIPLGDAVAHVRRTAVNQHGDLILLADGIYRGDMVKVDFKLR
ncbi:GntR family transcriptional regulator [Rhodobacterales bacterium HKCCE2091]|nr:GntR family transcriptional regulator [Rhodobacterales bacterium HKCCE2091]